MRSNRHLRPKHWLQVNKPLGHHLLTNKSSHSLHRTDRLQVIVQSEIRPMMSSAILIAMVEIDQLVTDRQPRLHRRITTSKHLLLALMTIIAAEFVMVKQPLIASVLARWCRVVQVTTIPATLEFASILSDSDMVNSHSSTHSALSEILAWLKPDRTSFVDQTAIIH